MNVNQKSDASNLAYDNMSIANYEQTSEISETMKIISTRYNKVINIQYYRMPHSGYQQISTSSIICLPTPEGSASLPRASKTSTKAHNVAITLFILAPLKEKTTLW